MAGKTKSSTKVSERKTLRSSRSVKEMRGLPAFQRLNRDWKTLTGIEKRDLIMEVMLKWSGKKSVRRLSDELKRSDSTIRYYLNNFGQPEEKRVPSSTPEAVPPLAHPQQGAKGKVNQVSSGNDPFRDITYPLLPSVAPSMVPAYVIWKQSPDVLALASELVVRVKVTCATAGYALEHLRALRRSVETWDPESAVKQKVTGNGASSSNLDAVAEEASTIRSTVEWLFRESGTVEVVSEVIERAEKRFRDNPYWCRRLNTWDKRGRSEKQQAGKRRGRRLEDMDE